MHDVDVSVVTYRPDVDVLERFLACLAEQAGGLGVHLWIADNSPDRATTARISALPALASGGAFATVDVQHSGANVGFGRGHNANAARGTAPFVLVLNQDCMLEPGVLPALLAQAAADDARVAAWELRQIPYEHPKAYDPVTLDVPWVSGAATLLRRSAFDAVGGFDPRIFMYGEDVDLSWRLRGRGFRLRYLPRLAVVHRTYAVAAEVKPLQVLGGVQSNLCLRARFGGVARTVQGLSMLAAEVLAPQDFPGRRWGLVKAFFGFLVRWPHFTATRVAATPEFKPRFSGWDYELRRDGAFFAFRSLREDPRRETPLVSILIRTIGRGAWLEQALASVAHQTWPNVEVVVIEDGPPRSQAIVERFRDRLTVHYRSTGDNVGRARAGNLALATARGEWLNFLDDDDVLFADHVEVLMETVLARGVKGAYALAWETHTEVLDHDSGRFEEVVHLTRHRQPFDRLTLWHHNYLPIQAVLFHRCLFERYGGFAEDMDQLEDWNLWTRYTLEDDFVPVDKTTSKYRVPARAKDAAGRQALLDKAYQDALARQASMLLTLSPIAISRMAEDHIRSLSAPAASALGSNGAASPSAAVARATVLEKELAAAQRWASKLDGDVAASKAWIAKLDADIVTLNAALAQQVDQTRRLARTRGAVGRLPECNAARLEEHLDASQAWVGKLEGDVATLTAELTRRVDETRRLADDKAAFDLLPELLRKFLLKRAFRARR